MKIDSIPVCLRPSEQSQQWPQVLAVVSASLMAIGSGFQIGWPSPSALKLLSGDLGFEVSNDEVSYVIMIAPLGYIIGSPLSGFLLDKIGRKNTLLLLSIPQIVPWILIATSINVPMLYIARFITGVADGALFTALPIYMCEILEPKVRGSLGMCHSLGIVTGVFLINCYGSYVSIRTTACISLTIPILFIISFIWMPESPYYCLMKNRSNDARKALKRLRMMHDVEDELSKITADVQRQISEPGSLRDVFTIKSNLKAFLIIFGLRTLQQMSGVSALAFYAQVIFKQADGGLNPAESTIVCCAIQSLVTICCSRMIDRCGRRPLTIGSSVGCFIVLWTMGFYFLFQRMGYDVSFLWWLPVADMMLFYVINAIGLLMVPTLMAGELLSASVKSKALGIINIYLGLSTSGSSKLFQWLDQDFGMHTPFFTFGLCCIVGALFCYYCVPETKGKTLEEIQQILKGNTPKGKQECNVTRL